ncbi:MAG: 8-oxoguanine DNA glycosylase [Clostridia bacterium]|nr:8-oxoguanine DNA glycosylase [Clostridia bacterium]
MKKFTINNLKNFELDHIFECGQCFRWKKQNDGSYIGVIKQGVIKISKDNDCAQICAELSGDIEEICKEYFDLETDYKNIQTILCKDDENMKKAIEYGQGIRILNQDMWEMLISFIISAANNIPRISKTIENISKEYGKKIEFEGNTFYLFPTPEELSKATKEDLRKLNLGFRDKYVFEATQKVVNGEINLDKIEKMPLNDAKKELMKIPGVGAKVADCILLFSMKKKEAFPVDTWIKKVMNELYLDSTNITKINEYASKRFGMYAGIAQQYLFYYKREN